MLIVLVFLAIFVGLCHGIIQTWPDAPPAGNTETAADPAAPPKNITYFGAMDVKASPDVQIIILVLLSGGLGSLVYAASSAGAYLGQRQFILSWLPWYVFRLLMGPILAFIFYMLLRGALMPTTAASGMVQPYGVVGISALVGLFSKKAVEKLKEIFDQIFQVNEEAPLGDPLVEIALTAVAPDPVALNSAGPIECIGSGFVDGAVVQVNGADRATTFVSATKLTAVLDPVDTAQAGDIKITVRATGPSGHVSTPVTVKVA